MTGCALPNKLVLKLIFCFFRVFIQKAIKQGSLDIRSRPAAQIRLVLFRESNETSVCSGDRNVIQLGLIHDVNPSQLSGASHRRCEKHYWMRGATR